MEGMRGSVFKAVFLNPLVWIGLVLTGFTLHYEGYEGLLTFSLNLKPIAIWRSERRFTLPCLTGAISRAGAGLTFRKRWRQFWKRCMLLF